MVAFTGAEAGGATALRLEKRTNGVNTQTTASDPPAVSVDELSMDFGGLQVLNRLSFEIRGTGTCAIVGPNGAGKTTLFNVISGEIRPGNGSVSINGRVLGRAGVMERRRLGVVRTFQKVRLVPHLSTLDNVALGRIVDEHKSQLVRWGSRRQLQQARESALATLESLGCAYLAGRPAGDITLAEQRLVELARAVCGRGTIFLLDEPASGLSDQQRDLLADAVQAIAASATVVLVEHDLRFVRRVAVRVIALERGSIIFDGTPTDMGRDQKVVEAYLGSEAV
jgi:ABC-type branched-subunit amino acid transport system ATPase component